MDWELVDPGFGLRHGVSDDDLTPGLVRVEGHFEVQWAFNESSIKWVGPEMKF